MSSQPASPRELPRQLTAIDGAALIVGGIIGSGIFAAPAVIARATGAPGLSLAVWLLAGLLALSGGLSFAELSAAIPRTGGMYAFFRRVFPWPIVGFLFGWTFFFVDGPGAIAAVGTIFSSYAAYFVPSIGPEYPWRARAVAVTVIALLTAINILGVRSSSLLQRSLTVLKVSALLGIVVVAMTSTNAGGSLAPLLPVGASSGSMVRSMGTALMPALFAFGGWSYSTYVAGEMRNPERDVPASTVYGVLVVMLIYLAVNAAVLAILPFHEVVASPHVASDAMRRTFGERGAAFVALAVMLSTLGALNAIVLSYARIAWAMAHDGIFFTALARVHPRFGSPSAAITVQGIVAGAFALTGGLEQILGYFSFVEHFFMSLGVACVIILRRREPQLHRPVRVWLYPLPPLLFLVVSAVYLAQLLAERTADSLVGVAILLLGVPFYLYWRRQQSLST